jgi:dihydrolipoamide dehydrogenase
MVEQIDCQVLVVGAGPGGYVAAIRAGQLGLKTVIVEGDKCGGTCLIRGCIPSKAMIHAADRFEALAKHQEGHMGMSITGEVKLDMKAMVSWKDDIVTRLNKGVEALLKKAGVRLVKGWATFTDGKTCTVTTDRPGEENSASGQTGDAEGRKAGAGQPGEGEVARISAENVILATGSRAIELPFMKFDEKHIISSTGALDLEKLPEKVAIIGGGYIGLELGCALSRLGSEVTVIEGLDSVMAIFDAELRRPLERWLKKHKVKIHTNCLAQGAEILPPVKSGGGKRKAGGDGGSRVELSWQNKAGEIVAETYDKVLVTVGRIPNTEGWGLQSMGVKMDDAGLFISIDEQCRTNMNGIFAIGDIAGEPLLAHKASAQGEMVAEIIAGHKRVFDPVAIPAIVFTEPEIVTVGLSPEEAVAAGHEIVVGKFPLAANGRALTIGAEETGGFVRVVANKSDDVVLGIQCVGSHVSELSGEFTLALEMGAVLDDIAHTIHAHPTMTESFHEGILATLGRAIHQ